MGNRLRIPHKIASLGILVSVKRSALLCYCGSGLEWMPGQRKCKICKAAYMREWRKTHPLSGEARKRDACRSKLNTYIKRGKIQRGPCEKCGTTKDIEAHHDDYSKALNVRWLCRPHHVEFTKQDMRERTTRILIAAGWKPSTNPSS